MERGGYSSLVLKASVDMKGEVDNCVCFLQVDMKERKNTIWRENGISGTVMMSSHMSFSKEFFLSYRFEARQEVKLSLFKYTDDQVLAVAHSVFEIQQILKSPESRFPALNTDNKIIGNFLVSFTENKENHQKIILQLSGLNLLDLDYFDKSDPYFLIFKKSLSEWVQVFRSEVVWDNLNPKWERMNMKYSEFCDSNPECLMKVQCFDYDSETSSELIGEAQFQFKELQKNRTFLLKNPKKSAPGSLLVNECSLVSQSSFLDYLSGGMKINISIAVDFTASNGLPTSTNSLHYSSDDSESEYCQAIKSICLALGRYDSDGKIPFFGFGGKPSWKNFQVRHDFALTRDESKPFVENIEELIEVYKRELMNIELSGPTNFSFVIRRVVSGISETGCYNILVIVTDGDISDIEDTIDVIVEASSKAISILIVGVGSENFFEMRRLDGDRQVLIGRDGKGKRDIVNFLRFRNFRNDLEGFAEKALEEIPKQIVEYMEAKSQGGLVIK